MIKVRRAGDEVEAEPGFFQGDTVAHCGPTLTGEFARTLNLTDVHAYRDSDLQNRLLMLAKGKAEQLYLASLPTALPDIHKGSRTKAV